MIYYDKLKINYFEDKVGYPYIPLIKNIKELKFTKPVTILVGGNGAGKSTLIKILSDCTRAISIGEYGATGTPNVSFSTPRIKKPDITFNFSAEEFIEYIKKLDKTKKEAMQEIERIRHNNRSDFSKSQEMSPYARTINDIDNMYDRPLIESSHGEGFIQFFSSRLRKNGFYLLDEPEAALSYQNQYNLAYLINQASLEDNSQFIIATHSPIISLIPNALIYEIEDNDIKETEYEKIENFKFLEMFLSRLGRGMF